MALILILETATKNCSVALSETGKLIEFRDLNNGQFSHSEKLHLFIEDVLRNADKKIEDLDAIAISKGPGSYTGLRIGVSAAKGLCYGLNIPLISINTLDVLCSSYLALNTVPSDDILIPMIDARRMEVYTGVYTAFIEPMEATQALILDNNSFNSYSSIKKCHFFGDGALKASRLFTDRNAVFDSSVFPSAKNIAKKSYELFLNQEFENTAYFEPFYLKDFVDGNKNKQ